jgi:hypothetical protein
MTHTFVKSFFFCLFTIGTLFLLPGCDVTRANGDLITETRNEKDFHALEVNTSGRVEVRTDSVFSIEVTCEENIMPYLETTVKNGVLQISFDRPVYDVDGLRILVSAPKWDAFEVNGSADIKVKDPVKGTDLAVRISGSGDVEILNADFQKVKITVTGSGTADISGKANDLNGSVSGSGDIEALNFPVKTAKASISGSGDIRLDVSDALEAIVSGSGDVEYKGNAKVDSQVSGSGRVRKL